MTDRFDGPRLDAETLAALMEGRLSDEERARALEVLAESDADLEVLADAAVAAAALSETSAPAEPPAPARPRRWTVWLPLAAVLAGLAIVPSLLDRGRDGGLGEWRADLARLGPVAPVDLPAPAGVDVTRSGLAGGASLIDSLPASARSFRRGATVARLTVLEPGARARSPDAATLAALLRSSAGSAVRPLVDRWLAAGSPRPRRGRRRWMPSLHSMPSPRRFVWDSSSNGRPSRCHSSRIRESPTPPSWTRCARRSANWAPTLGAGWSRSSNV